MQENNKQLSGLSSQEELFNNLQMNAVPEDIMHMNIEDYNDFLIARRKLMAKKIKELYPLDLQSYPVTVINNPVTVE